MRTVREVLVALSRRYSFRELAYLVGAFDAGLPTRDAAMVQQLCAYGQRLLDLDTEDLEDPNAARTGTTDTSLIDRAPDVRVPAFLVDRGRLTRARQSPDERPRAALVSTHPAARLILEVIAARCDRRETNELVSAVHLASEYIPLLAWQPYIGHGADPAEMRIDPAFCGPDSRWGKLDDDKCPHTRPQKSAACRALRVSEEPPSGWKAYLQRQHSLVSHALEVCATTCKAPCAVMTSRPAQDQERVSVACQAAKALGGSAIVRLRHSAPVGHGFGGPSPAQVVEAWRRSRYGIAKHGGICAAVLTDDGYQLPGLPSLVSAIAGTTLTPDTLIADTAAEITKLVDPEGMFA